MQIIISVYICSYAVYSVRSSDVTKVALGKLRKVTMSMGRATMALGRWL